MKVAVPFPQQQERLGQIASLHTVFNLYSRNNECTLLKIGISSPFGRETFNHAGFVTVILVIG
jgi:hypothetical protein